MFFLTACFITQAWAQDLTDESRQSIETDASTIFTKDYGTKFAENLAALSPAASFSVNNTGDAGDANAGDGICATATNVCTLRAAVQEANALPSNDNININLVNTTISLTSGSEIVIRNNGLLTINGNADLIIDGGAGQNRIFYSQGANVTLTFITLQGGNGGGAVRNGYGGAILAEGGSFTLSNSEVIGNTASSFDGGGVYFSGGTHRINNSTFSANTAANCGGFINESGTLSVVNSTISGNTAASVGGGFCHYNAATGGTTLRNVTITNNFASAGGGIHNFGTLNFGNTIVAGNTATSGSYPEIEFASGTITSAGGNLVGDSAGDSANTRTAIAYQSTDIRDVNPQLGALQFGAGSTRTHALLPGSPAIDTGINALARDPFNNTALIYDQRSSPFQRIRNGTVDIGAYEFKLPSTFTVNDTGDAGDANTADEICATATGVCTLRAAVQQANALGENDTINFAIPAGAAGCTAGGVCTITLTGGELRIAPEFDAGTLTITNATGASNLLISGNNASRVFYVVTGDLTLSGVTITNGNGTGTIAGRGGAIYNAQGSSNGTLTLLNSTVSGNSSVTTGGGIYNDFGTTTIVTNSTVSGNTSGTGGGIYNTGGTLTLTNSTVSGNTAQSGSGGGIYSSSGTLNLTNSTVSGNTAGSDGGGIFKSGTLNLTGVTVTNNRSTSTTCTTCAGGISNLSGTANLNNAIVAGNTVANASFSPDFRGSVSSTSSFNIIGINQGTTGITNGTNGNQVGTPASPIDPRLGPLARNGGLTETHALMPNSPAIDKGSSFGLTADQRGLIRPADLANYANAAGGDGADIGALEVQNIVTAASVTIGGRVMTASGRGIRNVVVTMIDTNGSVRTATSSSFGYYRFETVAAGETYIVSARGKRYQFTQSSQVVNAAEEMDGINFTAIEITSKP